MFWFWFFFHVLIALLLLFDLGVLNRRVQELKFKKAALLAAMWIGLALLFNLFIYFSHGSVVAVQFFTGFLVEKSLSVDNLFVFMLIFSHFKVPSSLQHKVLYYGIIGALIFRLGFILAGTALMQKFDWIIYLFGVFLCITAIKLFFTDQEAAAPEKNWVIRLCKRIFPMSKNYGDGKFFVRHRGKLLVTPLFIVLLAVEYSDILFAVDSIPAIFAITSDPFIVYTSNVFAILGLRSLYFLIANVLDKMRYFKYGLSAILLFVGLKMLFGHFVTLPIYVTLGVIALILLVSVVASLKSPKKLS